MARVTKEEKLHKLSTMVLTDTARRAPLNTPIYPFTETSYNQESVLRRSKILLQRSKRYGSNASILLIDNQGGSEPGYPGAPAWQRRLCELGVNKNDILLIPFTEPILHTLSEAFAVVQFAQRRGLREIVIVAPAFHLLRCFLSIVTAIRCLYAHGLRVFCQVGVTQPWSERVIHSQGVVEATRQDLIVEELRRIKRYQRKSKLLRFFTDGIAFLRKMRKSGNFLKELKKVLRYVQRDSATVPLCSTDAALGYLEWRDST